MYRGLVVSGAILALFGTFLISMDFYAPLGVSGFGLPILIIGIIMLFAGFWRPEPAPIEPEAGKKFCWYCMTQIPLNSKECSNCSLPQHDTGNQG
jgi:membrane-bound ClpP family serine protease